MADLTDEAIESSLGAVPTASWTKLWEAVDALADEQEHARWAGGDPIDSTVVDGIERPVFQLPYVIYSDTMNRVVRQLYEVGLVIPFRWAAWDGLRRYRAGHGLDRGPVADAVRTFTAIIRAERFCEGAIAPWNTGRFQPRSNAYAGGTTPHDRRFLGGSHPSACEIGPLRAWWWAGFPVAPGRSVQPARLR